VRDAGMTESTIEQTTLAWLGSVAWTVKRSQEITQFKLIVVADHFGSGENRKFYKELKVGRQALKRYSSEWIKGVCACLAKSGL
jgi:hypothetical protein